MIDERKDPELERVAACFDLVTGRVEELVDAGMKASRKSYFQGKLEVYQRMLQNIAQVEDGVDTFFMGSLWKDINKSRLLSLRRGAQGPFFERRRDREWSSQGLQSRDRDEILP
jgi:hypothetical protein